MCIICVYGSYAVGGGVCTHSIFNNLGQHVDNGPFDRWQELRTTDVLPFSDTYTQRTGRWPLQKVKPFETETSAWLFQNSQELHIFIIINNCDILQHYHTKYWITDLLHLYGAVGDYRPTRSQALPTNTQIFLKKYIFLYVLASLSHTNKALGH